jgi:bifunctional N-acetylglucosamine-1-phosphate-uridyltransferase/glucosamine-1-phosphate-acetyltransferase GlmU-like protein
VSKWLLVGNFQKFHRQGGVMSVDSWICFRWETANAFVHMTSSLPLQLVDEFWLTAIFWKMMGASIGKRTMIDPAVLAFEADLLAIGDDCQIREGVTLLCHKFNNGGLEFGPVVIPSKTCIGARAVVLPGSKILDENVEIMPLTHVLPSEELTVGTWHGSPAEKVDIEYGSKFSS